MAQSIASPPPSRSPLYSSPSHSSHLQYAHHGADIPVETLIAYLKGAKRSLSSIHLVHKATTVLSDAKGAIEFTAALIARTKYLRRSLASQLKILRGVQFEIEGAAQSIKSDIQLVFHELDETNRRLNQNIEDLKATRIDDGFKGTEQYQVDAQSHGVAKESLHDFIDSKPVDDLKSSIQDVIGNVQVAADKIDESIRKLEDDLQTINAALQERPSTSSSTRSDLHPNIAKVLRSLEAHAHEMAVSLESLVKHFDLCVTSIKHTEGAGAIVARTVNVEDLPEGGVDVFEAPAQPLTEEERTEMLEVLENDASEVEEVVIELQDRMGEMELKLEQILAWRETNEVLHNDVTTAFRLLGKIGARLSTYVAENSRFAGYWAQERVKIEDGMAGMEELCDVYANFLNAYDGLIVETARRRAVKKQMEKIAHEAQARLENLYDEDLAEREVFRTEQGDFLPSDIWAGLGSLPPRFAFQRIDDGDDSIPELPREKVGEALRRLKKGGRAS